MWSDQVTGLLSAVLAVAPLANRLVINKNTIIHKVVYSSSLVVERISIQSFVVKPKDD
jgi:hypothetical protein